MKFSLTQKIPPPQLNVDREHVNSIPGLYRAIGTGIYVMCFAPQLTVQIFAGGYAQKFKRFNPSEWRNTDNDPARNEFEQVFNTEVVFTP